MARVRRASAPPAPPNDQADHDSSHGRHAFWLRGVAAELVIFAAAMLVVQNRESARLDWLAFHFRSPLWIMLLLTSIAGGVGSEVIKAAWRRGRRHRSEHR